MKRISLRICIYCLVIVNSIILFSCEPPQSKDNDAAEEVEGSKINLKDANAYFDRGMSYLDKGRYERAVSDFTKAIEINPKFAAAYSVRGFTTLLKLGNKDKGCADLQKACELGNCTNYNIAKKQGDCLKETAAPEELAVEHSSSAEDNYRKGVEYAIEGKFQIAKEEFEKGLKIDPSSKPLEASLKIIKDAIEQKIKTETCIRLFKGIYYTNNGNLDQAIDFFNNAIQLNLDYATAYVTRGGVYYSKGMYESAVSDFNKTLDLDSKNAVAYYNRGIAYDDEGKYDLAISDYTKAIEINPKYAMAYHNRALLYKYKGQYNQAIRDYDKAIEINPEYALAYNNRGNAYDKKDQYDQALRDYNKSIEINPNYANAYFNRALFYENRGQYDQAISNYTKGLEINSKEVDAYINRGYIFIVNLGDVAKGCADFKKACELGDCNNYNILKQSGDCP